MPIIPLTINFPFEGCRECRFMELESEVVWSNNKADTVFTRCMNECLCKNAAELAARERNTNE